MCSIKLGLPYYKVGPNDSRLLLLLQSAEQSNSSLFVASHCHIVSRLESYVGTTCGVNRLWCFLQMRSTLIHLFGGLPMWTCSRWPSAVVLELKKCARKEDGHQTKTLSPQYISSSQTCSCFAFFFCGGKSVMETTTFCWQVWPLMDQWWRVPMLSPTRRSQSTRIYQ